MKTVVQEKSTFTTARHKESKLPLLRWGLFRLRVNPTACSRHSLACRRLREPSPTFLFDFCNYDKQ